MLKLRSSFAITLTTKPINSSNSLIELILAMAFVFNFFKYSLCTFVPYVGAWYLCTPEFQEGSREPAVNRWSRAGNDKIHSRDVAQKDSVLGELSEKIGKEYRLPFAYPSPPSLILACLLVTVSFPVQGVSVS